MTGTGKPTRSFVQMNVRIDPQLYARVVEEAEEEMGARSVTAWIEAALAEKVARAAARRRRRELRAQQAGA